MMVMGDTRCVLIVEHVVRYTYMTKIGKVSEGGMSRSSMGNTVSDRGQHYRYAYRVGLHDMHAATVTYCGTALDRDATSLCSAHRPRVLAFAWKPPCFESKASRTAVRGPLHSSQEVDFGMSYSMPLLWLPMPGMASLSTCV